VESGEGIESSGSRYLSFSAIVVESGEGIESDLTLKYGQLTLKDVESGEGIERF